jgi:hypothetical protein
MQPFNSDIGGEKNHLLNQHNIGIFFFKKGLCLFQTKISTNSNHKNKVTICLSLQRILMSFTSKIIGLTLNNYLKLLKSCYLGISLNVKL